MLCILLYGRMLVDGWAVKQLKTLLHTETEISNYLISSRVRLDFWVHGRLGCMGMNIKQNKNEICTSFSSWDTNGDKFIIFESSSSRDVENKFSHAKMI